MPCLRSVSLPLAMALWSGTALASDSWVESAPVESRTDARALRDGLDLAPLVEALGDDDLDSSVQRRFVRGSGWGFVMRLEGLDDLAAARQAAAWLSEQGVQASIWTRQGAEVVQVGEVAAAATPGQATAAPAEPEGSAQKVLRQAARSHGGQRGGIELLRQAESVSFDFERRVYLASDELLAANRYRRLGQAVRLEVDIVEGEGLDSRTVLTPGNEAWVQAGEDEPVARDAARTREVLVRFSPEGVLAIPLGLALDLQTAADWEGLVLQGTELVDGQELWILAPGGGESVGEGLVEARFGVDDGLLHHVRWATASGDMDFRFADYRELAPNLIVPHQVDISRDDQPVEAVRVLGFALEAALEASLFDAI